jgi:hypothetical protein
MYLPRHVEIWLLGYLRSVLEARRERRRRRGITDILLCVADHYEPLHGGVVAEVGRRRVERWCRDYPRVFGQFLDSDGRHPQHTFFFPIEQYSPEYLEGLAGLTTAGFGEVEVHLHHDDDTSANLKQMLNEFKDLLNARHGLLARDRRGQVRYGFVHGNWALDNSLPDGRWCGVNDELTVLRETGCYADFTLPAAPSPAQTRTVNRIYHATDDPASPKSHDSGIRARAGVPAPPGTLLMIQGALGLSFGRAKWGVVPRLENSALHAGHPPTLTRMAEWLDCGVSVADRCEWVFVKVHTHGAPDANARMLLGPDIETFHRGLLANYNDGSRFRLHYVTAREMANIVAAAEAGETGNPGAFRDYELTPPPCVG